MSDDTPRQPQNIEAEQHVLGAAMIANVMGEIIATGITGRDFYRPAHELVWDAISGLDEIGKSIDLTTLAAEMIRRGTLTRAGGPAYLHELVHETPTAANAAYYARIVIDRAVMRRLVSAGARIQQLGQGGADGAGGGDLDEILSAAAAELSGVGADTTPQSINAADAIGELIDRKEEGPQPERRGWRTGYLDLDAILLPLLEQQLVLFAARPSVGKSVCLRDVARHIALRQGGRVLLHSMEMSIEEVTTSFAAAEATVTLNRLKDDTCQLRDDESNRLADAYARFAGAYLHIDERESLSLQQLRASVRRHKPDVVIVDYIQLARSGRRTESRYAEVSEVARGLKNLAKAEKVLVIAAAQLKRDAANRVPQLDDLKDSGELEQAADTVVLIHREDMITRETVRAGQADFIVAKQRAGSRDTAILGHHLQHGRFANYGREQEPYPHRYAS